MSQPIPSPQKPPLTGGGVALIILGALLLVFPGGCSFIFMTGAIIDELRGRHGGEQYNFNSLIFAISGFGLMVAALGYAIIRAGLRRRQFPPPPR